MTNGVRTLKGMLRLVWTKVSSTGVIDFEGTEVNCGLQGASGVLVSCFFLMGVVGAFCFFFLMDVLTPVERRPSNSLFSVGLLRVCMLFAWLELLQV